MFEVLWKSVIVSPVKMLESIYDFLIDLYDDYNGTTVPLLAFIKQNDENSARRRLKENPKELRKIDGCRYSALHLACANGASDDFICELIDSYPDSVTAVNLYGDTPLHKLCLDQKATSKRVVDKMIAISEGRVTSMKNYQGETPLKIECRRKPNFDVIRTLVHADPSQVFPMNKDMSPLLHNILWDFMGSITSNEEYMSTDAISTPRFYQHWKIMKFLLRASQLGVTQDNHVDHTDIQDTGGVNYAHIILTANDRFSCWLLTLVHKLYPHDFQKLLNGRSALSLALENPYLLDNLIEEVFHIVPNHIDHLDPCTGVYPFMQAAIGTSASLDNIYFLLRKHPNLVTSHLRSTDQLVE